MECRTRLAQGLFGHPAGHLVEIGADQSQRMFVQDAAPNGAILHHRIQMFQKGAISAAHVADTLGLLFERAVEDFNDNLVNFFEIRFVCASASPDVHAAVYVQLDASGIHSRNPGITEEQGAHDIQVRKIGNGDAVRSRDLRRVKATRGQPNAILLACDPTLRRQEIEYATETRSISGDGLKLCPSLLQLGQDPTPGKRDHGWAYKHTVQMAADLLVHFGSDRIFSRMDAPALSCTQNEWLERRQDGSVGAAEKKVFQKNGLGDK